MGSAARFLKESIPLLLDLLEASGELDDELRYRGCQIVCVRGVT